MAPSQIPSLFTVKMSEGRITLKEIEKKISTYLIEHFCCPSGTILDESSDLKGTVSLAALQSGHSGLAIMESEKSCLDILQQMQDKFVVND